MPLWFAVTLRKKQRCTILAPQWLKREALEGVLQAERQPDSNFAELPYHYIEIGSMLLDAASEDIPDVDRVRSTLEDVQNVRMAKIRAGFQTLAKQVNEDNQKITSVNLTGIAALEIFQIRPFMISMLNQFHSLATEPTKAGVSRAGAVRARRRAPASSSSSSSSSSLSSSSSSSSSSSGGDGSSGGGGDADGGAAAMPESTRKLRRFR